MDGSNPFSFTSVSDAPIRIHCKTEVKMALTEIDGRFPRPHTTYFGRRGPWGALARVSSKQQNWARRRPTKTQPRSNTPWAGGPANLFHLFFLFYVISLVLLLRTPAASHRRHPEITLLWIDPPELTRTDRLPGEEYGEGSARRVQTSKSELPDSMICIMYRGSASRGVQSWILKSQRA